MGEAHGATNTRTQEEAGGFCGIRKSFLPGFGAGAGCLVEALQARHELTVSREFGKQEIAGICFLTLGVLPHV